MQRAYINIPLRLLVESKSDKEAWLAVSVAIAIKMRYISSAYRLDSVNGVRKAFHCGKLKAEKIISILNDGNFFYRMNGIVVAKSFKKAYCESDTVKNNMTAFHMNVIKMECVSRDNIRISEIEKRLRLLLYQSAIAFAQKGDELKKASQFSGNSHASSMTLSQIGKRAGRSRSTAIRYNKILESEGSIEVKRHPMDRVCDNMLHDCKDFNLIEYNNLGFIRKPNTYKMVGDKFKTKFAHVIFNHKKRLTDNSNPCTVPQLLGF